MFDGYTSNKQNLQNINQNWLVHLYQSNWLIWIYLRSLNNLTRNNRNCDLRIRDYFYHQIQNNIFLSVWQVKYVWLAINIKYLQKLCPIIVNGIKVYLALKCYLCLALEMVDKNWCFNFCNILLLVQDVSVVVVAYGKFELWPLNFLTP